MFPPFQEVLYIQLVVYYIYMIYRWWRRNT